MPRRGIVPRRGMGATKGTDCFLDYKKTIGFTPAALASLPSVRYNDPPDLVEERF
jgi:hypothetical protein